MMMLKDKVDRGDGGGSAIRRGRRPAQFASEGARVCFAPPVGGWPASRRSAPTRPPSGRVDEQALDVPILSVG